jgi:hypothetical protein
LFELLSFCLLHLFLYKMLYIQNSFLHLPYSCWIWFWIYRWHNWHTIHSAPLTLVCLLLAVDSTGKEKFCTEGLGLMDKTKIACPVTQSRFIHQIFCFFYQPKSFVITIRGL